MPTGTIDIWGRPCMSDEKLFGLIQSAQRRAAKAARPRRQVLLHKSVPSESEQALPAAQHLQELATRLAVAVREHRIGSIDAARAETCLGAGQPLPADLLRMLEG
ncbi:MAG: hypothetical protein AB7E55_06720 [Pigmentiphaga sp.]